MSKLKGTPIPDDFQPNESTLAWLEKRYPQVDGEIAVERFLSWACNYSYQNHQRTFQGFLNREADNNKLGPMLKKAKPRGELLIERAKSVNFRMPNKGESHDDYERAIDAAGRADVAKLGNMLRSVGR